MAYFRGIYQFKQNIRLPLADIYQELGFLKVGGTTSIARLASGCFPSMKSRPDG